MRRRTALAGIAIVVLVGTACTASGGSGGGNLSSPTPTGSHAPVTLTLWSFYTNPEYPKYNQILDSFEQKYPWITVKHVGGKSPQDILRAINSGTAPDVAIEAGPDDVAKYCDSGAFVDLKPTIDAEKHRHREDHPAGGARLHELPGQAVRAAGAVRRLRPVLQQQDVRRRGHREPAEDVHRAPGRRAEADQVQPGRQHQGRRVRSPAQLLRDGRAGQRACTTAPPGTTRAARRPSRAIPSGPSCSRGRRSSWTPSGTTSCRSSSARSAAPTRSGTRSRGS